MEEIVVGLPLTLMGESGAQAGKVRAFVRDLRGQTGIPIETIDERLSTVQARRMLTDSGGASARRAHHAHRDRKSGRLDAAAAAVILQAYLDASR